MRLQIIAILIFALPASAQIFDNTDRDLDRQLKRAQIEELEERQEHREWIRNRVDWQTNYGSGGPILMGDDSHDAREDEEEETRYEDENGTVYYY